MPGLFVRSFGESRAYAPPAEVEKVHRRVFADFADCRRIDAPELLVVIGVVGERIFIEFHGRSDKGIDRVGLARNAQLHAVERAADVGGVAHRCASSAREEDLLASDAELKALGRSEIGEQQLNIHRTLIEWTFVRLASAFVGDAKLQEQSPVRPGMKISMHEQPRLETREGTGRS